MSRFNVRIGHKSPNNPGDPSNAGYAEGIHAQMKALEKIVIDAVNGIDDVMPGALAYGVQPIFDQSRREVPKDTYALHDSAFLQATGRRGNALVKLGYARGGNPNYAIIVHERMDLHHDNGTKAKFLEDPIKQHRNNILPRVIRATKRMTGLK